MTPGQQLALAAVAALAAAGAAQKRGSASTKGRPRWLPEKLVEPLSVARSTLGLTDIRVSRDKKIYLIGAPRTLKGLLKGSMKTRRLLNSLKRNLPYEYYYAGSWN